MAIISCPECGNSVSDKAATCPHCGMEIHKKYDNSKLINALLLAILFPIVYYIITKYNLFGWAFRE